MMPTWGLGGGGGGMGGGGGFGMPGAAQRRFEEQYHCYSVAFANKSHLEKGDKILLPPSAFDTLARLQVDYPMLFKLSTANTNPGQQSQPEKTTQPRITHSGVLEFTAEEGCCYIPHWMMQNLLIEEGTLLTVSNVSLPKATFVKLQPQHIDFLEISNPRVVLEHALRNFSCVTEHDIIQIQYNSKYYHLELKKVEPSPAACIIETDCNVDFDPPIGYVDPTTNKANGMTANGGNAATNAASLATTLNGTSLSAAASNDNSQSSGATPSSEPQKKKGVQIIDGKIVRPDDDDDDDDEDGMLANVAKQPGTTGIQKNAAIPEVAPDVDYWAVAAGDGARLDGKQPAAPKDKHGNELDVRRLRAEAAAARRSETAAAANAAATLPDGGGVTVAGEQVEASAATTNAVIVSKRKKRVGNKYSRLKNAAAFGPGSANQFHQNADNNDENK